MEEWMYWISENDEKNKKSSYDVLAELAVSSYGLDKKSRKAELKDKTQYFVKWLYAERKKMKKYITSVAIAELLNVDHSTVLHLLRKRKPTYFYDENTACLRDFLKS